MQKAGVRRLFVGGLATDYCVFNTVMDGLRLGYGVVLLTDLYELTMLQAYFDQGMEKPAVFEFFVRTLPPGRTFLIAAGLEQVLDSLESLRFSAAELNWLADCGRFHQRFVDSLADVPRYPVEVAPALLALTRELDAGTH